MALSIIMVHDLSALLLTNVVTDVLRVDKLRLMEALGDDICDN